MKLIPQSLVTETAEYDSQVMCVCHCYSLYCCGSEKINYCHLTTFLLRAE